MNPAIEGGFDPRRAGRRLLGEALRASREDTLATFALFERALEGLAVPRQETLNPPLWELGHVGWFQEFWIARNPHRHRGLRAGPGVPRGESVRPGCDSLYDSSAVPHATRWTLPLPEASATRGDLERQLAVTLALLDEMAEDDAGMYFFRLALLHEDMHHEAALYMAQSLGIAIDDPRWQPAALPDERSPLSFDPGPWRCGGESGGFAFDNELDGAPVTLPGAQIDRRVLRWAQYLPFVEEGGYGDPRWWSEAGRSWLAAGQPKAPRYLRRCDGVWQRWRSGLWDDLDPALAACHLTYHEAQAWCRWAGRRLPTEAEWERAALQRPDEFLWGQVWEWTSSAFVPYPGFSAHPYRDYSSPWFGSRPVLRGASFMTQARMRHPRYRNFFLAHRNDVAAGFRTCAL